MQNEEFDAGPDPELDDDEIWYSDDPQEAKKLSLQTKAKAFVPIVGLLVAAVFFLPTTVGGKITIGSGGGIEFGQGVSQIVTCGASPVNLTVTPNSDFANASNSGTHYFKSIKVSGITAACVGVDFKLRAYDNSSSNPLAIFDTNKTLAVVRVVSTSNYSAGTGISGTTVSSAAGSFSVSFDNPVAVSTTVAKLTIETGPQYILNQSVSCGGGGFFTIVNNVVTSNSNCSGSIVVPVGVTAIGSNALKERSITAVSLPIGLRSIGASAFYRTGPATVVIPSTVDTISDGAFWESTFSSITFQSPSSLRALGPSVFRNISNMTSITIPDEVETLNNLTFATTRLVASPFTSSSRLTSLGTNTFQSAQFTSFVIPSGVTSLLAGVFSPASEMRTLTIPNGLTSISATAFAGLSKLTCVVYAGSSQTIKDYIYPNGAVVKTDISLCT